MKLSEYARKNSVTYRTAWNRYKSGKIKCRLDEMGHILVEQTLPLKKAEHTVTYSRVSSSENKDNLERQSERLRDYCNAKGWGVDEEIKEIGSGLNEHRPKLLKLLNAGAATRIVVENKDRLARFGTNYIIIACKHCDCDLHIVNTVESKTEDLIPDFITIITSFCSIIYGKRRSKRKTEKLIEELKK